MNEWAGLIGALLAGEDLRSSDTAWAMDQMMRGEATPAQIAAFVVALRAKGETPDEVTGLAEQMLAHAVPMKVEGPALDVVGTGGDQAHTVNISTMASIVAASAGARVVKHGNRAATSKCGSADVLAELGVVIDLDPDGVAACIDELGIGFCFAPVFHPSMRYAGPVRSQIGVPTVFNILGPLANPARPSAMLVGCADLRLAPVMARVLSERETAALVVRGLDGIDEITVFNDTEVWDATSAGNVIHTRFDLSSAGLSPAEPEALKGGDAAFNAAVARQVFAGESAGSLGSVRAAVALSAAAALVAWDSSTGTASDGTVTERIAGALPRAFEAIDSGETVKLLDRWIEFSQRTAG